MIYNTTLIGKPGKIVNIIVCIAKRFCFCRRSRKLFNSCSYSAAFYFCFLFYWFPGEIISCQQPLLFFFILQLTGSSDNVIFWNSNSRIKIAEFTVKFSLLEIWNGMPTLFIIDCGLWIPLRNLVTFTL